MIIQITFTRGFRYYQMHYKTKTSSKVSKEYETEEEALSAAVNKAESLGVGLWITPPGFYTMNFSGDYPRVTK